MINDESKVAAGRWFNSLNDKTGFLLSGLKNNFPDPVNRYPFLFH